jgi:hypothetical protein
MNVLKGNGEAEPNSEPCCVRCDCRIGEEEARRREKSLQTQKLQPKHKPLLNQELLLKLVLLKKYLELKFGNQKGTY